MCSVGSLVLCLPEVVALPMQLPSRDIDRLIEVETPWEDAEHVYDPLKVVEVAIYTVGDSCVLHLDGHTKAVFDDGFVHLADGGGCEWVKVDLLEVGLPILSVLSDQVLGYLL